MDISKIFFLIFSFSSSDIPKECWDDLLIEDFEEIMDDLITLLSMLPKAGEKYSSLSFLETDNFVLSNLD